jgi:CTP-dependent riboflavin kinase
VERGEIFLRSVFQESMSQNQVYQGIVRTGRGGGAIEMIKPGALEQFKLLTGLPIIPGTLNIKLVQPFDLSLLKYYKFDDIGWEFDPTTQGIPYQGEIGMYGGRLTIAGKYHAFLVFFTWVTHKDLDGELVSPYHLRSVLNLQDGDSVEFTLAD